MPAVIALHPESDRGGEILDELEKQVGLQPLGVEDDGTRRYYLPAEDADVDAFDPTLDEIDSDWRDHVTRIGAAG